MKIVNFQYLLFFFFLIFFESHSSVEKKIDLPCQRSLAISLKHDDVHLLSNESFIHDGIMYPPNFYWREDNSTYGCTCEIRNCIRKCCQNDEILSDGKKPFCIGSNETIPELKPYKHQLSEDLRKIEKFTEYFGIVKNRICPGGVFKLEPEIYADDNFIIQSDGSLKVLTGDHYNQSRFCIDLHEDLKTIVVLVCHEAEQQDIATAKTTVYRVGIVISIPFLLATLIVYAIIPELKNLYGMTLMCYVGCLISAYLFLAVGPLVDWGQSLCAVIAFVIHFAFLASFFWLNVMCFDIWWTFGGFRSLQGSVKQRERKKFIIYSAYAWGSASVLTGVCLIMDFVPGIPKSFIKPEFGVGSCWFTNDAARALYFYGPMGVTVVCNICLFVLTAMKIIQHKKDTAHHLKGMDSHRHDDNKQWFNLYLKLFIVMGINWSMEIISWICKNSPHYLWYITDLANTLQGVIIFLIFVWKDKIKRLLMKRLGCHNRTFQSRNSTRSCYQSSASRTATSTATMTALHDFSNTERTKTNSHVNHCV